tara:strand:- start:29437 stop:30531 length:1095 start_codon:yes stop_codon:yes gene_type:complete
MHSTTAPFNNFEKYKKTADFIERYHTIYSSARKGKWDIMLSFTGGEPTLNPAFYQLIPYLKEKYPDVKLNLTTNGTWGERKGQFLIDQLDSITVSYHCEGTDKQKELIRKNLLRVNDKIPVKVNVMMHVDYFEESVDFIENFLKPNNIKFIPRVIGDDGMYRAEWFKDADGAMRRTSHIYSEEQLEYLNSHWNKKNKEVNLNSAPVEFKAEDGLARKMGRMCCGGRCMTVKQGGEVKDTMFIEQSNFYGYNCMINWFFLHIEEDRDAVYHHQTCMAKLPGAPQPNIDITKFQGHSFTDRVGPICTLSEGDTYLDWLQGQFDDGKTPTMICPRTHCGCGVCIAKAKDPIDFKTVANKFITLAEIK